MSKKKEKRKNKRITLLIVFLLILFILISFFVFYYLEKRPLQVIFIDVYFGVDNYLGLVSSNKSSVINFGVVPPGNAVGKKIDITNKYDFPVVAYILVDEEMERYLFGEKEIRLLPNQTVSYPIELRVPPDAETGNYSGRILIRIERD